MTAASIASAAVAAVATARADAERPHIVLIVADDLGFGDPGCFNPDSRTPTPRIDRLAAEGIRFTDAHAPGSVCVPSRYGLLTGRYPFRNDRNWTREPVIDEGRMTIASLLGDAGYRTAMVGKWHQGFEGGNAFDDPNSLRGGPIDRGFETFRGMHASLDIPPYFFIEGDRAVAAPTDTIGDHFSGEPWTKIQGAFWRGGAIAPGFRHDEVLPRFADQAIGFLDERSEDGDDRPFFLYLALAGPHTPWLPSERFEGRGGPTGLYGEFVANVDAEVGRVLDALDRDGFRDRTLVIFTSDNGPVWYPKDVRRTGHSSAADWRGMKGDAWEGGHRMPLIVRWPGRAPEGSTCDALVGFVDFLATFAALVGRELPEDAGEDSRNILPLCRGETPDRPIRDSIVAQSSGGVLAYREGPWKLIPALGSGGFSEPRRLRPEPGGPAGQLYDLASDPGERTNLYLERPEVARRLGEALDQLRSGGENRESDRSTDRRRQAGPGLGRGIAVVGMEG